MIFCLPETLYSRKNTRETSRTPRSYLQLLKFTQGRLPGHRLTWLAFIQPFKMLKYPSVLLPTLYYSFQFGFGTIEFAVVSAFIFSTKYNFNTFQTGLALGIPLLAGCCIGELFGGKVTDFLVYLGAKKSGKHVPESRLMAIWTGAIALPVQFLVDPFRSQLLTYDAGRIDHFRCLRRG
jgi:hypothetical protein